ETPSHAEIEHKMNATKYRSATALAAFLLACAPAHAQQGPIESTVAKPADDAAPGADTAGQSATDLAKKIQNPIGDLYSFPFQNNANFGAGPHGGVQNILNIQPVIPIHVNDEWNIITRTILPVVWNPDLSPLPSVPVGTGPTDFSAFLSPKNPTSVWGGGPTAVLVYMKGPIVAGVLSNNVWSFGGVHGPGGNSYNGFLTQPFFNYNFGGGWYVGTAPIVTADWQANGTKWTVPVGANAGRVFKVGKLPINVLLGAYYNIVKPQYGAAWQLRTQLTLIF